jgi:hypothetical protein
VIRGENKFEQLMVAGHEIAASTAQLVSASRVKAPSDSVHALPLEDASRAGITEGYACILTRVIVMFGHM